MKNPYQYLDRRLEAVEPRIIRSFNKNRLVLGTGTFTNSEISKKIASLYETLGKGNYSLLLDVCREAYENAGGKSEVSEQIISEVFETYLPLTEYVYKNEVERKRMRFTEAVISRKEKGFNTAEMTNIYKRNASLWISQLRQYGIEVVDAARKRAFMEDETEFVEWVAEDDAKTCSVCEDLDGEIFELSKVPDKPHRNCRCYLISADAEE